MGKKKKKAFIDKKNAYTFQLVHRSQQDPLIADEEASQYLFKPTNERALEAQKRVLEEDVDGDGTFSDMSREERIKEQKKYGIFYDDEYDYMQHLKERQARLELVAVYQPKKESDQLNLPKGLFPSKEEEEIGMLNKAAPLVGPQLDWDPDIVAAMDEDFDYLDPENELEEDFVKMATSGDLPSLGPHVYLEQSNEEEEDVADLESRTGVRPGGKYHGTGHGNDSEDDDDYETISSGGMSDAKSRFTDYSLSSSVVPRNEGLTHLDNKFEKFMETYDEELLGALDELDITEDGQNLTGNDQRLLQLAVDDFEKNFASTQELTEMERVSHSDEEEDESSSSESDVERIEVPTKPQWDCESVLSTYSNLYNHPTKIKEPVSQNPKKHAPKSYAIGQPTTSSGDKSPVRTPSELPQSRPRNETKEQKKARKQAVKEDKKMRREVKKLKKTAFKEEEMRLTKQLLHTNKTTTLVV